VDDEKHVREAIFTWFSEHGFSVQVAENGARAVDLCEEETFDLVIMDLEMPVMKGPAAIQAIRTTLPDLPIIVFSGFSTQTQVAVEMGANLILQKPLGLRELEREVREFLSV
jgi:DNA-binding response OmpR family regulator